MDMNNVMLVKQFFIALGKLNEKVMNECLADDIIYNDPVVGIITGNDVKTLWKLRCIDYAKGFQLQLQNVEELDEEYLTCSWTMTCYYAPTGRRVVMPVKSFIKAAHGKIIEHSDAYRLSSWLAKAYGWKGYLLGWTGMMKRSVQRKQLKRLHEAALQNA